MVFKEIRPLEEDKRMGTASDKEKDDLINETKQALGEIIFLLLEDKEVRLEVLERFEELIDWAGEEMKSEQANLEQTKKNINERVSSSLSEFKGWSDKDNKAIARIKEIFTKFAQKVIDMDWDPDFVRGYIDRIRSSQIEGAKAPVDRLADWVETDEDLPTGHA